MAANESSLTSDLDEYVLSSDRRQAARDLIGKLKIQILTAVTGGTLKSKTQLGAIEAGLDDVYELFVEHALELVKANQEIEALKVQLTEKDQRIVSFADVTRTSVPEEKVSRIPKSKRPVEGSRKTRAAGSSTDHVLLIYPRDGK